MVSTLPQVWTLLKQIRLSFLGGSDFLIDVLKHMHHR